ncbi:MAG: hypothetical protein HC900_12785, partial [Methylacidiphilales bacterium]|nr:hypothetical protein [Candidatus Methylacidiphilales bacterium]
MTIVTKVGSEISVNTETANYQRAPTITGLANGGYVVTWRSESQDGSSGGIYAQRYTAAGVADGPEVRMNTTTVNDQSVPAVMALADGGYLVTWQSAVQDGSSWGIYAQRCNAAGVAIGPEVRINTTTVNIQEQPAIAALPDGGYVVTWQSYGQDGSGFGTYAQRYDAAGVAVGGEVRVNTTTASDQRDSSVTALVGGGYVVSWQSYGQDGSGWGTYAQRYDAAGVAAGGEFLVNTQTASDQWYPTITGLSNGGFVVTWTDYSGTLGDSSGSSIKAQVYDASGAKVGSEFLVNTETAGWQEYPSITGLTNGGFVVTWQDSSGTLGDVSGASIKAQIYAILDAPAAPTIMAITDDVAPVTVALSDGAATNDSDLTVRVGLPVTGTLAAAGDTVQLFDGATPIANAVTLTAADIANGYVDIQTSALADGAHTIAAAITGGGGTSELSAGFAVTVDTVAPDAPVHLANAAIVGGHVSATDNTESQAVTGTAEPGSTVAVSDNGTLLGTTVADAAGGWSYTLGALASGSHSIIATATDAAGNTGAAGLALDFVVDPKLAGVIKVGGEFLVNTVTAGNQTNPSITALADGRFVVTWEDSSGTLGDSDYTSIKAQFFDASGSKVGSEFLVNTQTVGTQAVPSITALINGGFVVTWVDHSYTLGDSSSWSIAAQMFDSAGTKVGSEFLVNTQTAGTQAAPSITALTNGGFVVTWEDLSVARGDVKAQIFDATATNVGSEFVVSEMRGVSKMYPPSL